MGCFVVPAVEAIVTTVATKVIKSKEKKNLEVSIEESHKALENTHKIAFSRKLGWLNNLLWGGSALLAFEHLWHGEVTPWFPFLTGAATPQDTAEMLHEMSTVGVTMAITVTAVWVGMLFVSSAFEKKMSNDTVAVEEKQEEL